MACFLPPPSANADGEDRLELLHGDAGRSRVAVDLGDLRRTTPLSDYFGFDRGTPIDRVYIERFLRRHRADVRGRVLEVKDRGYTTRVGGAAVERSDVLDVDAGNPAATVVADLERPAFVPADAFDCFILTQTLQLIFDTRAALTAAHRLLRPGGTLLVSVPGISQLDSWSLRSGGADYWRFTSFALERLLSEAFPGGDIQVEAVGNVLAATAFLQGMAAEELTQEELDAHDPAYELLLLARAVKARAA